MRLITLFAFLMALVSAAMAGAASSSVLDLTKTADFEATVGKGRGALVEFFAPWCGHCKTLAPKYEELADRFISRGESVVVAKVDADTNRELGQRFGVRGFPTLMWFKPNSVEPELYSGARDVDNMAKFIEEQSGKKAQTPAKLPPAAVQLTASNYDSIVNDPSKHVFVEYYAPWCGYCKKIAPVVDRIGTLYADEDDCVVAQMDADDAGNKAFLSSKLDISGYPTFKMFGKTDKDRPEPFQMTADPGETEAKMVEFINARCYTHRVVGGGLSELAGRLPLLDTLASRFFMSTAKPGATSGEDRQTVLDETRSFVGRLTQSANATEAKNAAASYYVKVMDKMMLDDGAYVEKETKRIASLLKKHADGTSMLAARKYDDLKRRANILTTFAKREMSDKARQAAERITKGHDKDEL